MAPHQGSAVPAAAGYAPAAAWGACGVAGDRGGRFAGYGGRRARVRGLPKDAADFALLAAAVNLARLDVLGPPAATAPGRSPDMISRMAAGLDLAVTADPRRRDRGWLEEHHHLPGPDRLPAGHSG